MSEFSAIIKGKCPRCRQGDMFVYPAYHPKFSQMHERCPHCDLRYEVEKGFFWGAMYVSYAITVAIFVAVFTAVSVLVSSPTPLTYIASILLTMLLLLPITFRYSRVLMLHIFGGVNYEPKLRENAH